MSINEDGDLKYKATTDISEQDEREAREWFNRFLWGEEFHKTKDAKHARTILALLDRPVLPRPEDVPDAVLDRMDDALNGIGQKYREAVRSAYRALYDHYNKPPAPKKVEAWAVVTRDGEHWAFNTECAAASVSERHPGSRIVHLREVEADHD